jgi:transposase, IS5 family
VLRETDPQTRLWELLAEEAKRLPAELARVDAYLDDECFIAPWRTLFDQRLGRPSVPIDTLLRLLYLKHRYGLGYESLCREVADSISWRRFCHIGLDRPVPHPTTLVKLVGRAGPETMSNSMPPWWPSSPRASCCGPASCGWITRWWRSTSTIGPMPTCWRMRSASLGGLVRRIKGHGAASKTQFRDRGRAAGRGMQAAGPHAAPTYWGSDG